MNSSPVKVKLIIFPLFLPEGNAILPMTAKEACGGELDIFIYIAGISEKNGQNHKI